MTELLGGSFVEWDLDDDVTTMDGMACRGKIPMFLCSTLAALGCTTSRSPRSKTRRLPQIFASNEPEAANTLTN